MKGNYGRDRRKSQAINFRDEPTAGGDTPEMHDAANLITAVLQLRSIIEVCADAAYGRLSKICSWESWSASRAWPFRQRMTPTVLTFKNVQFVIDAR